MNSSLFFGCCWFWLACLCVCMRVYIHGSQKGASKIARLSTKHNQNPWFAWHYNKTLTHGFETLAIEREGFKCWAVLSTHIGNGDVLVWIFFSRLWVCDQLLLQIHLLLLHWGPWQEHGHQGKWTFPGKSSNAKWQFPCKPNIWSLLDWLDLVCIK